jgi:Ca-activated chloride channel homolog
MTGLQMALMSDEEVARYGRDPDAGFGALDTARGRLPLTALAVDARVVGVVASVELVQTFVNTTGTPIEATYIFPLPDRAAVHRFQMAVGERVIDGAIDEREVAREHYDAAIAAGHRAAITEEERAGVFTLRVGNLMPGEVATVRLSLVGPLPVDDGEVTFRFPLVVAPRYIPGTSLGSEQAGLGTALDTDLVPDASRISPPVRLPGCPNPVRLSLRVKLADGVMRDVASSLHAVTVAKRDAQVIEVQPGERLDRDFVLRWRIDGRELASSLVCVDDPGGAAGTFALTIVPPSTQTVAARPRDVVFVIDRSGSMDGWKMIAARRAAARMIDTLSSRDRFAALAFDDRVEVVPERGLVDATDRNRFRAVEALAKVESRGGTELSQPLRHALGLLVGGTADRERVIVVVTDGQVGNEDQILRELAPGMRNVKMFALGIDQAVNAAFLRRLAAAGGGLCELVESEDRLDAVMAKVHRRIGTPIATELAIDATGLELDRGSLAPGKLPDVYAGAPVVIFGRYRGAAPAGATLEITGTTLGDPLRMTVRAATSPDAASWLAASWARAHLRELEDRYLVAPRHDLEQQIVRLSKQFSVLSRFTAFLAIDRSEVAHHGGAVRQVIQAVEPPAGWDTDAGGMAFARGAYPPEDPMMYASASPSANPGGPPDRSESLALGYGAPARPPVILDLVGVPPPRSANRAGSSRVPPPPPSSGPASDGVPPARSSSGAASDGVPPARSSSGAASDGAPPPPPASARVASAPSVPAAGGHAPLAGLPDGGPPAMPSARRGGPPAMPSARRGAGRLPSDAVDEPTVEPVYFARLAALARELAVHAAGPASAGAIRLVRERLTQWVEDLRSVAGANPLADAIEELIARLSAALGAMASLASEAAAVAAELAELAAGAPPPATPSQGRPAFWK